SGRVSPSFPSCTLSFLPSPLPQRFRPPHSYSFFYCFIRQAPSILDAVPLSLSTFLLWPIVACHYTAFDRSAICP
ncbi:hypothetical protein BCR33DRAFT_716545, partial [Rhizoclosmatium globosum]